MFFPNFNLYKNCVLKNCSKIQNLEPEVMQLCITFAILNEFLKAKSKFILSTP